MAWIPRTLNLETLMTVWSVVMLGMVLLGSFPNRLRERWRSLVVQHSGWCSRAYWPVVFWLGIGMIGAKNPAVQLAGGVVFVVGVTPVLLRWVWGIDIKPTPSSR